MHRAHDLYFALEPLARHCPTKPAFWVTSPDGEVYTDYGSDFCGSCASAICRNRRRRDRKRRADYRVDGGWRTEHDVAPYCGGCGVKLDACRTGYGASRELEYYAEVGVRPGNALDALCLLEVLNVVDFPRTPEELEMADEAADLAEAMLWSCV